MNSDSSLPQPAQAVSPVLSSQQPEGSEAPAPSAWKPPIHTRLTLPTSSFQVDRFFYFGLSTFPTHPSLVWHKVAPWWG